jgi:hypothetical protein
MVRVALTVLAFLLVASPAAAIDRYVPMKVPPGPGPAKYDRVFVQQTGPRDATRPGTSPAGRGTATSTGSS